MTAPRHWSCYTVMKQPPNPQLEAPQPSRLREGKACPSAHAWPSTQQGGARARHRAEQSIHSLHGVLFVGLRARKAQGDEVGLLFLIGHMWEKQNPANQGLSLGEVEFSTGGLFCRRAQDRTIHPFQ